MLPRPIRPPLSRRPSLLTLLVGSMLVLLPLLAALQYRWVGQLSDAEHERLQRTLTASAMNADLVTGIWLVESVCGRPSAGVRRSIQYRQPHTYCDSATTLSDCS